MLHDEGEHLGLNQAPRRVFVLLHADKVGSEEDGTDALDAHELDGERRGERGFQGEKLVRAARGEDGRAGDELERVGVGRRLGLDE